MPQQKLVRLAAFLFTLVCCVCITGTAVHAQDQNIEQDKLKATDLINATKYVEALPLLEKIVIVEPDNAKMHFYLGFALLGQANIVKDDAGKKALSIRARNAFIKAKELGYDEPLLEALIQGIPPDGVGGHTFSHNIEENAFMGQAEG